MKIPAWRRSRSQRYFCQRATVLENVSTVTETWKVGAILASSGQGGGKPSLSIGLTPIGLPYLWQTRLLGRERWGMVTVISGMHHVSLPRKIRRFDREIDWQKALIGTSLLAQKSMTMSDGRGYGLEEQLRPSVPLSQAWAAWKPLPTSLATAVIDDRNIPIPNGALPRRYEHARRAVPC